MAVKAPPLPPVVPVYNWTGFYLGLNGGGGWSDPNFSITPTGEWLAFPASIPFLVATDKTLTATSFLGGGQASYNYEINRIVFGVEGDYDYYHAQETFLGGPIPTTSIARDQTELAGNCTRTPRVGGIRQLLIYGTGGVAFSDWQVNMHMTSAGVDAVFQSDQTRTGWTAGAGMEYGIDQHWSAKAEFLYMDFGNATAVRYFCPRTAPTSHITIAST